MKKYIYIFTLFIITLNLTSCTEGVFIDDISTAPPKLVIDANINWDKNNTATTQEQVIKISLTTNFYNNQFPAVAGASVKVFDSSNNEIGTFLDKGDGSYIATDITVPTVGETYKLEVIVDGQTFIAEDTYTNITDINEITQQKINIPEESVQVNVNIDNEIGVDNYYLVRVIEPQDLSVIPFYGNGDDQLLSEEPGDNNYDIVIIDEDYQEGVELDITIFGISKRYNDYLSKLIEISQEGGGPFATAPATVRGNLLNTTDETNFALGFFSMNQFTKTKYVINDVFEE